MGKAAVHFFEVECTPGMKGVAAFGPSDFPNPQNAMPYTTSAKAPSRNTSN